VRARARAQGLGRLVPALFLRPGGALHRGRRRLHAPHRCITLREAHPTPTALTAAAGLCVQAPSTPTTRAPSPPTRHSWARSSGCCRSRERRTHAVLQPQSGRHATPRRATPRARLRDDRVMTCCRTVLPSRRAGSNRRSSRRRWGLAPRCWWRAQRSVRVVRRGRRRWRRGGSGRSRRGWGSGRRCTRLR
jgi:hypothetical protein